MSYLHGVGNSEVSTSLTTPTTSSAGLQVIFGTAPIHLAKDPYKAANTPKLCYSFAECQEALGYSDDFENFTLCQSMDANFRVYNNSPIVLVNVLDPNKAAHITENAEETVTVTGGMATYAKQYVLLPSLVVKNDTTPLAADVDYSEAHQPLPEFPDKGRLEAAAVSGKAGRQGYSIPDGRHGQRPRYFGRYSP